jgi:hypothetical protein
MLNVFFVALFGSGRGGGGLLRVQRNEAKRHVFKKCHQRRKIITHVERRQEVIDLHTYLLLVSSHCVGFSQESVLLLTAQHSIFSTQFSSFSKDDILSFFL